MRYGVSDDKGRTCKEYWSTVQFMFREEWCTVCGRWGKLGEVLRENREVVKRREGGQTESVPE